MTERSISVVYQIENPWRRRYNPRLSMKNLLIIPAYNEEEALPRTIESLQALPGLLKTSVSKT